MPVASAWLERGGVEPRRAAGTGNDGALRVHAGHRGVAQRGGERGRLHRGDRARHGEAGEHRADDRDAERGTDLAHGGIGAAGTPDFSGGMSERITLVSCELAKPMPKPNRPYGRQQVDEAHVRVDDERDEHEADDLEHEAELHDAGDARCSA